MNIEESMKDLIKWKADNDNRWFVISSPSNSQCIFVTMYDPEYSKQSIRTNDNNMAKAIEEGLSIYRDSL